MKDRTTINVRARKQDVGLIDQAAAVVGKSRSAFIRECVERDALAALRSRDEGK